MNRFHLRWPVFLEITAVFMAVLMFGAVSALAQGTTGTITGTVVDPQGAVIPEATITLVDISTKQSRTSATNQTGQYVLTDVPPGTYNITVTKTGFEKDQISALTVEVGNQTTANFKMTLGAENTVVEVQASNADLQTMNATTGQTVEPVMVESLPAIGRDVATFVTMQPGVTPGGMVAGTTQDQASFSLDGGSNSSDMDGTNGVYTSGNTNSSVGGFIAAGPAGVVPMPQDSVEEFKVNTTGQTADFNNSSGSQSQIVTKRGHDQWHGTVYEYYLDNNFNANTWSNNFSNAYTAKPSYHYSRFGVAFGGPAIPKPILGGKTYFFANYEGFRYPAAGTYERTVPSYQFLQLGQLTTNATYSAAQLKAADPRGIGFSPAMQAFYNKYLPVAPASNSGNVGNNGATYAGIFDTTCGALSTSYCDGTNLIGYKANISIPQSSNFLATRIDHDFGAKWHLMASYRYYNLQNSTSNQVDIGGGIAGDKVGTPTPLTPRPQQPWFLVIGMTTNISSSMTNDFHYSYLHNFWQWKGAGAPPLVGTTGAVEPLGENTTTVLSPFNVNAQNIRTRIWDGKDHSFSDNLSKLKGDHLIQIGGQFQHNYNYHQRTDNGASINYTPTYQLGDTGGGGNITYSAAGLGSIGANTSTKYARWFDTYYGLATDTQVANTYSNVGGTLTVNPPATPIGAHTTIPYYNIYVTDTWHARPSLTVNYGLSYALEMPPSERNGNQVVMTDSSGNAIDIQNFLKTRQTAAISGNAVVPILGFALKQNVAGGKPYYYDPFYKGVSPRLSFAWNPTFKGEGLRKIFGDGATVIRGGYGRSYGRINGDLEVLNPLLSPGLILATQCKAAQNATAGTGGTGNCNAANYNETTAYRIGPDGTSPVLASAALPTTLAQPYRPGIDGPGVSIASPLDHSVRPSSVDTFNLSVQRQVNRKMLVEVGYIGRLIHHEYVMLNPNAIPYMTTAGGQSFESAYQALEGAFGCTVSAGACLNATNMATLKTPVFPSISDQPFFDAAFQGTSYCTGYANCATAVLQKNAGKIGQQNVFSLWQSLENAGWTLGRTLTGTATSNATYGSAGQLVTGASVGTSTAYSNYHGGYVSFKASNFHGLTLQENLTYSKALGIGAYNQSTSSITAEDSYNLKEQYGRQSFDQKFIFNTFLVYQTPWYKDQHGLIGRAAGGWTLSPVVVAGTGQPLQCVSNNNGQNFGGEDGSTFTDQENCVFTSNYGGGYHTHRGVAGGADAFGTPVGTVTKGSGSAAVNMFPNPVNVWNQVRPAILGLDSRDGGYGPISGLGYLNMDFSIRKTLRVWEKTSLEFSGTFNNFLNHLDFSSPNLTLQTPSSWGVTKTQGNSPRAIQMGVRASF